MTALPISERPAAGRFQQTVYRAALAYYGKPPSYARVFTKRDGGGLRPASPAADSGANRAVWLQANETAEDFALKKPGNHDIVAVRNVTLDFEYPPDPAIVHELARAYVATLVSRGLVEPGQPIEDSGAGAHIVIPIAPLVCAEHGGPQAVNDAIAAVVAEYFLPPFEEIAAAHDLAGLDLEAYDIARIISVPGTWRPGGAKPDEAAHLLGGHQRAWLPPDDFELPTRRENAATGALIVEAAERMAETTDAIVATARREATTTAGDDEKPGEHYNRSAGMDDVAIVLCAHGWSVEHRGAEKIALCRPGKRDATGATIRSGQGIPIFYSFSTNCAPFVARKGYAPFGVFGLLEHGGDFAAAARALRREEYGAPSGSKTALMLVAEPQAGATPDEDWGDEEGAKDAEDPEEPEEEAKPTAALPMLNLTDLGNAQRLSARYGANVRYTPEWGWLGWNGTHWQRDASGVAERYARMVIGDMYRESRALRKKKMTKSAEALVKWAFKSEASARLDAMVHQARYDPGIVAKTDQFDTDPWLLTCANGAIDLRTGELRPHRREDYATRGSPVAYNPDAPAPTWQTFLTRVLPDAAVRAFVQRFVGYTLTGLTGEQCLAFLWGHGSNGKSTLLRALKRVLGGFAAQTPPETLMIKQQSGNIPNDIAALAGCRLVITIEVEDGKRLAESLIKSLTGQDSITARFMRKEFFTFEPTFKVWLAANHKPIIRGTDHAIWRRIHLVPFTEEITLAERKADPQFEDRLFGELEGILAWCVEGCRQWREHGLAPPEAIREATTTYREEMDAVQPFLDECCALDGRKEATAGALYASYVAWCQENAEEPLKQRTFGTKLTDHGLKRVKGTAGKRLWKGVALLERPAIPAGTAVLTGGKSGGSGVSGADSLLTPHMYAHVGGIETNSHLRHLRHQDDENSDTEGVDF